MHNAIAGGIMLITAQMAMATQLLFTLITTFMKVAILLTYIRKCACEWILFRMTTAHVV